MTQLISIPSGGIETQAVLSLPHGNTHGLVLFAHGSGSSRHSPRNRFVAEHLQQVGLGTLLFDLLTEREEIAERYTHHLRFDVQLLAQRLVHVTTWIQQHMNGLPLAYFGASTGAGAALVAAAELGDAIKAVVSRGGRPDLAEEALGRVTAPTLLIVGGHDEAVIELNRDAMARMSPGLAHLEIVPGATHLFEEAGALAAVASLAAQWLMRHLVDAGRRSMMASEPRDEEAQPPDGET